MVSFQRPLRVSQVLAAAWLVMLVSAALGASWVPARLQTPDLLLSNSAPLTPGHWLGTDPQGQDVAAALVLGARTAVLVSLPAALLATVFGSLIGMAAGYWGDTRLRLNAGFALGGGAAGLLYTTVAAPGWEAAWCAGILSGGLATGWLLSRWLHGSVLVPVDTAVSAVFTLLASLSRLVLVLVVAATVESSLSSLIGLMVFTTWPYPARLVRAETLRVRQLLYLDAARAAGLPTWRVLSRHLLPSVWRPAATALPLSIAMLVALESTLSFLGAGLPPETPSWGRLLALSRLAPASWWLVVLPGLCLVATALALRNVLQASRN